MRICGKRASQYSQPELYAMYMKREDFSGNKLTAQQVKEIRKVYEMRVYHTKEGTTKSGTNVQGRV